MRAHIGPPMTPFARPGWDRQLWRFILLELKCCVFPILIFAGLAVTQVVWSVFDPPMSRADALLVYVIVIQLVMVASGMETLRELGVICAFHVIGLTLEVFKVAVGSWEYPDPGTAQIGGVPLYSGFMYASVGSYICQAFRRFDLTLTRYRPVLATVLAVLAYLNFFTHHFIPDMRWLIALGFLAVLWPTRVHFTVGPRRYWMPLALAYVLIGCALWVAENGGTLLQSWRYPGQETGWEPVHVGKLGSWTLLVSLSFALVATVKSSEGVLYGEGPPRVTRIGLGRTAPGEP